MEDYHEADLNSHPEGGQGKKHSQDQYYSNGTRAGGQQVRC